MTTLTEPRRSTHVSTAGWHLTPMRVIRSEWIKLTTLRSTWWSIAIVAVLSIGMSLLIVLSLVAFADEAGADAGMGMGIGNVGIVLMPIQFTMLLAGALGAMASTGEYSTGMIRSTLAAEPQRGRVLVAKAIAVAALLAVSTALIFAIAAAIVTPLAADVAPLDWTRPEQTLVPLLYGVLSMVCFALIGLGIGFALRNGPAAISTTIGILFVLPIVLHILALTGMEWTQNLADYLPSTAVEALVIPGMTSGVETVPALVTLAVWTLVPLVGGWAVLRTRDA